MVYSRQLFDAIESKKHLSRDKFKALYGKLKKNETQELYLLILSELEKSLLADNCGTFDAMSKAKVHIHEIESAEVLKDYIKSDENPFFKCNLVIMACKHNKLKILKHMHKRKILNSLSYGTGREVIAFNDQDETCHNAFYYAIRSDNVELLEALIGLWSGSYFNISSEDLEDILCTSYKELKLRRVPFSLDMEAYVINKIVELRFRPNASQTQQFVNKVAATQTRIDIVLEKIKLLSSEYSDVDKYIDDRFLYISKIIAFNIHVLKRRLRFSYDTLPWEEMEFCLCVIVLSYTEKSEINLYNFQYLSKEKIIFHLGNFSKKLEEKSEEIIFRLESILECKDFKKLYNKPNLRREVVVDSIIKSYPEFQQLYSDYTDLRDIHSLHKIHTYIKLASSISSEEKEGQIIIMRAIQVIGEHLKNTLDSPKLSTTTSELLLLSLPKTTGQILTDLRNSLSHSDSLEKRIEIEKKADVSLFKGIQTDLEQIGRDISTTFLMKKMKAVHSVLKKIISCTNIHDMREALLATDYIDTDEILAAVTKETDKRLKLLVQRFRDSFSDKTKYEQNLLDKIDQLMKNCSKGNENYYRGVLRLKDLRIKSDSLNVNRFNLVRDEAGFILHDMSMEVINANYQNIYNLLKQIYNSVCRRLQTDELNKIILELCKFSEIAFRNFEWIEELREMLSKKVFKSESKKIILSKEELKKELDLKVLELDKHITNNVCRYMENKNAQTVTDLLVLDILSISDRLSKENDQKRQYKDDIFFLDQDVPLITGQSLRNHLAHCNTVFDLLITDPKMSVFVNAKRLNSKISIFTSYPDKSSILKNICDKDHNIVINQQNMLSSLEKGNWNSFKKLFSKGADLNGRGLNSWTTLHFASQGPSLKAVKYIIKNSNIPINCKNENGELPLHIAVKYGMKPIVEFYIKEKCISVNSVDKLFRTPLHFAAIGGHCEILSVLLELKPDIATRDIPGKSSLHYAIMNDHLDIVKLLLESNVYEDIESLITPVTCVFLAAEVGSLNILNYLLENQHKINDKTEFGFSPFHIASQNGHLDVVEQLISKGAEINAQSISGVTPLHFSAANGHETITDVLVKNGADVNAFYKCSKETPLHLAIAHGYKNIVKLLLANGAYTNALTEEGMSPLYLSAVYGHIEIVDLLLKFEIDIDFQTEVIPTALHGAAMNGHAEIVDLLIKKNAKVDARENSYGQTPLHVAAAFNHINVINILLKNGAKINALSSERSTPLHIASSIVVLDRNKYIISEIVLSSHTEIKQFQAEDVAEERTILVEVLLKNKAEVNFKDIHGKTPLHLASSFGYEGIVNALIKYKADINSKDEANLTPLHYAVMGNHKECVELLLENEADISDSLPLIFAVDNNNEDIVQVLISDRRQTLHIATALERAVFRGYKNIVDILLKKTSKNTDILSEYSLLHVAANNGHNSIVKTLMNDGTNVNMVSSNGTSPLHLAAKEGHQRTVEILLNYKASTDIKTSDGITPLHIASALGHHKIVKLLIKHGSSVNIKDSKNRTSLQLAVDHGHIDVVKTLIETGGADLHVKDNNGYTLLHVALEKSKLDILKYLVIKECDVHVKEDSGLKAIHIAAREGSVTAVQFFLNSGFSINDTDSEGWTLLHHAVIKGRPDMVNFLIKQGIDVNAKDNKGLTPLHIAATYSHKDLIEMLITNGAYYDILDDTYKRPSDLCKTEDFKLFHSIQKLFEAVQQNNLPEVENCIKDGAIVNSKNCQNLAPLHLASRNGNTEIVNILLKIKGDSNILGKKKFTPLHYACGNGNLSVVKALLCREAKYNIPNEKCKIPLQLATDKSIVNLLTAVGEAFQMIERNDPQVLNKLKMLKKNDSLKAALNARNKGNKSLTEIAFCKNFQKIKELERILQEGDEQILVDKAERDLSLGEYSSAIFNFKCVLEKRNEFLGPSNPFTLDIKAKIANCFHDQGRYNDALKLREKICRKQSEMFGENNKYTLDTKTGIASTLRELCENEKALVIFSEIYLKQNQMLGSDHEDTLLAQLNRAIILTKLEKYEESLLHSRNIYEKTKNNCWQIAFLAQYNIGDILSKQGKLDEALKLFEDVFHTYRKHFGPDHRHTLYVFEDISNILAQNYRYFEACKNLEHVVSVWKKLLGPFHPITLETQTKIAKIYYHQGKTVSAFKAVNEIIELRKECLGNNNPIPEHISLYMEQIRYELKDDGLEESDLLECLKPDIIIASQESDIRKVKEILEKGANVNERDIQGRTPLHLAVANNARDLVKFLLENEADVTQVTIKGETPLHIAAARGRKDIAEMLLNYAFHHKLNNPLNFQKTFRRNSALHVAARNGDFQLVLLLLKFGAIYNLVNDEGNTPLDISIDERICNLLMLIKELFENAKTGNVKLIELIKNLKEEEVHAVTGACNKLQDTLLRVLLENKHQKVAENLSEIINIDSISKLQCNSSLSTQCFLEKKTPKTYSFYPLKLF